MNVAILHFHLRRGGVTSVILKQVDCLALTACPPHLALIAGTPPPTPSPVPVFIVPELDYDSFSGLDTRDRTEGAEALARSLGEAIALAFPQGCDLLHVHNPLLCKNARLVGALRLLQSCGQALLVQVHDMAEDFRPRVYESFWPYPEACDYAALNNRDRDNLIAAGLEPGQVHFLPNPITSTEDFEPRGPFGDEKKKGRPTALYPVRAIRRKNLGEALLLSRFLPEGAEIAVTLPPTSRADESRYKAWKTLASDRGYPVRFEAGSQTTLPRLYDQAFCAVTTSVKEGFGFAYLDPLIRGIPVVGRKIPQVVDDFTVSGVRFEGLYPEIRIPLSELPRQGIRNAVEVKLGTFRTTFGTVFKPESQEALEALLDGLSRRFTGDFLDFGALDETHQSLVLTRIQRDPGFAAEIARNNTFLAGLFENPPTVNQARDQREAVLRNYSEQDYGEGLLVAYEKAAARTASGRIDKAALVERYLKPSSFFLVAS